MLLLRSGSNNYHDYIRGEIPSEEFHIPRGHSIIRSMEMQVDHAAINDCSEAKMSM